MTNAISTAVASKYELFNPSSDLYQARAENVGEPLALHHLITVTVPTAGGQHWTIASDGMAPEATQTIEGILVAALRRGVIWPHAEFSRGDKPAIVTDDLITARVVGDLGDLDPAEIEKATGPDGVIRWNDLVYTQWNNGQKPRAQESRELFVLRPGEILPIRVIVRGTSLSTVAPVLRRMTAPVWRHIVSLGLEKRVSKTGIAYSVATLRIVEKLAAEQGEVVKRLYADPIGGSAGTAAKPAADAAADCPF